MELFALKVRQRYLSTFHTVRQRYLSTLHAVSGTYLAFTLSDSGTSLPSIRSDSFTYVPCNLSVVPVYHTVRQRYLPILHAFRVPIYPACAGVSRLRSERHLLRRWSKHQSSEQKVCPLTVSDSPALGRGLETPFSISILELRSGTRHAHASSSADVGPAWRCG